VFLKELQMSGFKSFAQTVQVLLEPGVTAVVGPNGSGKSNIVDAVRWVLGEQSARVLRGARSEDVIFAGSAARRPLGMAEVTLVLDNSDRRVALDLEEIAISRRLYRSGDTEYLLNHRRARLRDVLDVAGQAGLGPDSYCVVGQGAIEQLALMRPQDRRSLVADAADIRRYEARLAEIESDLNQTQQNALRVSAVVAEVRPQLERLRVQADRAQRHRDFRDEVERLAGAWYGRALPAARAELEAAERRGRSLQTQMDAIRVELVAIERRRTDIHEAGALHRQRVAEAERALQEMRGVRERDRVERATAHERLQSIVARVAAVAAEQADLASQLASAREALAQSTAAAEGATSASGADNDQVLTALREAQARLDRARMARGRAESELQRQRNTLASLERDEMKLRARAEAAQITAGQRSDVEARMAELTRSLADAEEKLRGTREGVRGFDDRHGAARADVERSLAARRAAETALTAARRTLDGLVGEEKALSGLERKQNGPEARVLVDQLPVPLQYRRAILVALGAAAQYQVVDATDTAWFVSETHARGNVEPVLIPRRRHADDRQLRAFSDWVSRTLDGQASYRLAPDVIESGSDVEGLALRYLGATIVVVSLGDAQRAATRLSEAARSADPASTYPFQVASEDGHCLRWNGEHRVGPRAAEAQALQVEERRAALAASIANARAAAAEREREIGVATDAETAARNALRAVEDERSGVANEVREHELSIRGLRAEIEAEEKRLVRLTQSMADADVAASLAEIAPRQEAIRAAIRQAENVLRDNSTELAGAQAEHRTAAEQQAALTAQRALLEERRARLRDAMQRDARELERLTNRHQAIENEAARLSQEEQVLAGRLHTLETTLREADQRVEANERQAASASKALEDHAGALEAVAREFEAAQERLADVRAEQATSGADAEHARGAVGRLEAEIAGIAEALAVDPDVLLKHALTPPPPSPHLNLAELASLDDASLQRRLARAQRELRSVGAVDYGVLAEYNVVHDRYQFLTDQLDDLTRAETAIREGMAEAQERMRTQFLKAFEEVNVHFKEMFRELFRGGDAELLLSGDPDSSQCGIDIAAQPPGKRLHRLATLSGGERSLVGAALLLALVGVNPSPFCMLDEVDAALDETNVQRFVATIRDMSHDTQFVLVTHNRATMEMADALYGVTMSPGAVSQIVAMRLEAVAP